MSGIELRGINKNFDKKIILDDINLTVKEGEMISLLGPSGCGKTTTLKIIAGLIHPDNGDILFNGISVINIPVEKRGAVIVFQDYLLFPHLNVKQNIEFGLKMAKANKKKRIKKVNEMIDLVKLNGHEEKYPNELSGGQRQRVAIARALSISPKVLLLDEPFSNLDTILRENMRDFICKIQKDLNITTILVTHDKEEALMTSDKIAVMLDGKIKQYGTPKEIYENPISEEVADFFGEKNYIDGLIENNIFKSKLGNFKTRFSKYNKVKAMIKPEDITILSKEVETGLNGKIISKKFAGDKIFYKISSDDIFLKCTSYNKNDFNIGEIISIEIDFDSLIYFKR